MGEECKRKRMEINGKNFYLVVGKDFIEATVPHENRPESLDLRNIVDTLCTEASELLRELNEN